MASNTLQSRGCLANGFNKPRVPPKEYRIGELVEYSGFSRQTIHNYATMGLIQEARWTKGGHRLFDEGVFGRLAEIARLRADSKSLQQIREHFGSVDQQAPS